MVLFWTDPFTKGYKLNILRIVREKAQNLKAIRTFLGHSKPKIFSIGQTGWLAFFSGP